MPRIIFQLLLCVNILICITFLSGIPRQALSQEGGDEKVIGNRILIFKLTPAQREGKGYKLVYMVDAPLEVFWKFKTDFDNNFLESNKYIRSHRFIGRQGNVVITHNEYANKPGKIFKWQTTVDPDRHRLDFKLLNPPETGQIYHYGYIQLEALGVKTKVTQVAYFDFFGASLWVNYPFYGGMQYYLKGTTRWEKKTIIQLKDRY